MFSTIRSLVFFFIFIGNRTLFTFFFWVPTWFSNYIRILFLSSVSASSQTSSLWTSFWRSDVLLVWITGISFLFHNIWSNLSWWLTWTFIVWGLGADWTIQIVALFACSSLFSSFGSVIFVACSARNRRSVVAVV
jgi:hypothetical protein